MALAAYQVMCECDSEHRKRAELFSFQRTKPATATLHSSMTSNGVFFNCYTLADSAARSLSLPFLSLCVCVTAIPSRRRKKRKKRSVHAARRLADRRGKIVRHFRLGVCALLVHATVERAHAHIPTPRMPSTTIMHQSECIA